jgi:ABC-2 type transport system permease protein
MKHRSAQTTFIAFYTLLIKEVLRFVRIWVQTILPAMITTALYFIIFGELIGSQIGDMDGVPYIDYIVPGLILMSIITNSYGNVVSSFYQAKYHHHIEEILVSPTPNYAIIAGYMAGGIARGMTVGFAVWLISLLFTSVNIHSIWVILSIGLLTSALFSLAGLINAIFAKSFDDITIIPNFVLTPLTYLGGVFYSLTLLPPIWQKLSLANPILYMINGFRYGFLGVSDISLGVSFGLIGLFILSLYLFCLYLLRTGTGLRP